MESRSQIALIVGGSRGIGRAVVLRLAQAGFDIWLTYRSNRAAAEEVQAEVCSFGRTCDLFCFDVADHEATQKALAERACDTVPYAVVFNAGIACDKLMFWMTPEEWSAVLDTNLSGFYNVMRAVLTPMLAARQGRIVAIASLSGEIGQSGQTNYAASKAGLIGAVKALAHEVGPKQLLVNAVSPGVIETEMTERFNKEAMLPLIPLRRFGRAEEVAALVQFLCAEPDLYIHGQVLSVNGGLSMG
jgi:3-oxoacyl-[acyl-carrier protein] reductase